MKQACEGYSEENAELGGKWYTTAEPTSSKEAIKLLDLPQAPGRTNTAEYMVEGILPPGNEVQVGRLPSGATQMIIEDALQRILFWRIFRLP